MNAAIAALGQPVRVLPARPIARLPAADDNGQVDPETVQDADEFIDEEKAEPAAPRAARRTRMPKFLTEMKLEVNGRSLKEYCTEKDPRSDNAKYLAAAGWLTKYGGYETFTLNHIFTCFRAMGWKEQKDFGAPMRSMKRTKSYFDVPGKGEWKLTTVGLAAVENLAAAEQE